MLLEERTPWRGCLRLRDINKELGGSRRPKRSDAAQSDLAVVRGLGALVYGSMDEVVESASGEEPEVRDEIIRSYETAPGTAIIAIVRWCWARGLDPQIALEHALLEDREQRAK